ncbi:MAG: hypothetical protein Q9195_000020 [Heterodermia aff. obscurata]
MAAMSSGRRSRPSKLVKGGTESSRKHRFQSFNQRTSKLKIDPVHRTHRIDLDAGSSTSYFQTALNRWRDLNLSEDFKDFVKIVAPLCESLPQILHYQKDIMGALVQFIERANTLSLEPLLDLLASFARDLGPRFESDFPIALRLVASLAASHSDVETVEWSFDCLAWLFKYLSRLLVPDLRPVYQIMAPLLGKEQQKTHTTRFAAESLSFLIRKAALMYHKNPSPLDRVIEHMIEDLSAVDILSPTGELYRHGLMTLFVESIKGVDRKIHSSGAQVYTCLLNHVLDPNGDKPGRGADIVYGLTVGIIHFTDPDGFQPILQVILEKIGELNKSSKTAAIDVCGRLLFIAASVRKGSRISDWAPVFDASTSLLELCDDSSEDAATGIRNSAAVAFSLSPLEVTISKFHSISWYFLNFKIRWVLSNWQEQEVQLILAIPTIIGESGNRVILPELLQQSIVTRFMELKDQKELVAHCNAILTAIDFIAVAPPTSSAIMDHLESLIEARLASPFDSDPRTLFGLGAGLRTYTRLAAAEKRTSNLWPAVYEAAAHVGTLPPYLEAIQYSLTTLRTTEATDALGPLLEATIENLHSSSHVLRRLSLQIMDVLHVRIYHQRAEIIATALTIEENPLTLESARPASMHARKLSVQYKTIAPNNWLLKAIPHFCFGLLTFKLSQLCNDAIDVLKAISSTSSGEDIVSTLAFQWLEGTSARPKDSSLRDYASNSRKSLGPFECLSLAEMESVTNVHAFDMENASQVILENFEASHRGEPQLPADTPSLALRVLTGNPHIAEKRSRQLVPILLRWAADDSESSFEDDEAKVDPSYEISDSSSSQMLAHKDRKAMLDLLGHFVNPKVLYRASEVQKALLGLLTSGDVAIQKSALRALLTWKSPSLLAYEENLMNLLDDVRFREEIAIFVNVDKHDSTIQDEHRRDLMPVLLRILYGKIISRSGPTGRRGQNTKRKAVLEALARFEQADLADFVRIALGPLACLPVVDKSGLVSSAISHEYLDARKQVGLVTMMKDMLGTIGDRLAPVVTSLMDALLYCSIRTSRILHNGPQKLLPDESEHTQISMLKHVRQVGLHCLTLIFQHSMTQDLGHYLPAIFDELIIPRLENFPVETSQSVSGLLHLFSAWASSRATVHLFSKYDSSVLRSIVACLDVETAKDEVKLFVLNEVLQKIVMSSTTPLGLVADHQNNSNNTAGDVLSPHMDYVLRCVGNLMHRSPSRELLESAIHVFAMLAPHVEGSLETKNFLKISTFLLNQPSNRVKPKSKGDLLRVVERFVPLADLQTDKESQDHLLNTISSLFGFFRDRVNRESLLRVLNVLAEQDDEIREVTAVCADLNAFSAQKLDEPDFELRLKAFSAINETQFRTFSPKQWRPIVYNMLFYIRDQEELAIRSNASYTLRRFVEVNKMAMADDGSAAFDTLQKVLLPALRAGILDSLELVRAEYLSVMAHLIRCNPEWEEVNDMSALLCNDDDEASFFSNILHIQQHRRLRALRRLAAEARNRVLRSVNVAHFFIPLVEHFIFDRADDESAHNLSAETVITVGALARSLEWPQFRAMFRRFTAYIHSKPDLEKTVIRLLSVTIDALNDAAVTKKGRSPYDPKNAMDAPHPAREEVLSTLAATLPRQEKFTDDLTRNLLPSLTKYLHDKDESTVSLRVPVAISVVKLLQLLPATMLEEHLAPVLTDVCNILRSRSQESRDLTRKTLVEISTLLGPSCFGFTLKELRSSLSRGYQLHVLSFTVHEILVATANTWKPGELDYCLPQIVSVIIDDIFGATGQEKDAEEYVSKMKEVKSSKSYDSVELVARLTSIDMFVHLIRPLQILLQERLDLKIVKKVDESFRRLGVGLLRNENTNDRRVLVFCHEIIRESYKTGGEKGSPREDPRTKRFLVNVNGQNKHGNRGSTSSCGYKLARFSLDVLRLVLHKYDTLQSPSNIHGFLPIIGDSICQSNEEIQVSALRLLTTVIKVPLKDIDDNAGLYISESVRIVKNSTTMSSELAQAALKLVSSVLRERKRIEIRETDLAYLLKRLVPELEEPDRQGVAFNFLKAVLARKVVISEVYEALDVVAAIMVTNQAKGTRDVARSTYFQFIQDYPQAKGRFSKQVAFLVRNLDYKHQEGRRSVMEAIHLFLSKFGDDLVQELLGTFFVPLVMVMVNDELTDCREMAGTLVKMIFEKADDERKQSFLITLRSWLGQQDQSVLVRVALQVYCIFLDSSQAKGEKELAILQPRLLDIFKRHVKEKVDSEWEVLYFALQAFLEICQKYPTAAFSVANAQTWASVRDCLAYPHVWVKLSSAKLLGRLFAHFTRTDATGHDSRPTLKGSGGLCLEEEEMIEIARTSLRSLRVPSLNEELASQSVRNLLFLGRNLATTQRDNGNDPSRMPVLDAEDIDDGSGEETAITDSRKTPVQFILERASAIIRRGPLTTTVSSLIPMKAALKLVGALCNHLPTSVLAPSVQLILLPLHNLTDPSIPTPYSSEEAFTTSYKDLVANSSEVMSLLQEKMGTTEYISSLARVREGVKERREGRRVKRRIEAVAQPEKAAILKRRKGEKKKDKRKDRSAEERGRRRGW